MPRAMRLLTRLTLLLLALAAAVPAEATQHMAVGALAETQIPAPGKRFAVAVVMTPERGWHGYWRNPGDAGAAPELHWTSPPGTAIAAPDFPVPQRLSVAGIMNYVYEGRHALIIQITPPASASGRFPLSARIDLLVCSDTLCVPEKAEVSLPLTIGDGRPDPAVAGKIAGFRQALPRPLGAAGRIAVTAKGVRLSVPLPASVASDGAYFFPLAGALLDHSAPQAVTQDGDRLVIETGKGANLGAAQALDGVLALPRAGAAPLGLTVRLEPGEVAPAKARGGGLFLAALLAAVLGGLVLNLMPCVFPILSLKAISLARAGTSAAVARREGLAYAAGAVLACLALGAVLLALRASGQAVGWAFQLQEPRVVLALLVLVTAIALNLAGLFALGGAGRRRQAGRARRQPPAPSGPARSPRSSRRPAPGRSWVSRSARRWCCRGLPRWRCSPALASALPCRSSRSDWSRNYARCCRVPACGWSGCATFWRCRCSPPRSACSGCLGVRRAAMRSPSA